MSIFDKRVAFKPFEYPEVAEYKNAITHSYWLVSEWNFISDIHDFNVKLEPIERKALKNAMLAISQIEISVKKFWTRLGDRFPKAEFDQVGVTFGESEVRHSDAYSHLLEVLGMNKEFDQLMESVGGGGTTPAPATSGPTTTTTARRTRSTSCSGSKPTA